MTRPIAKWSIPVVLLLAYIRSGAAAPAPVERFQLDNGLRVLVSRTDDTTTRATLLVDAGWADDPEGASGTAEVVASLVASGTDGQTRLAFEAALAAAGARLDVRIARDYTLFELSLAESGQLGPALNALAAAVARPALDPFARDGVARAQVAGLLALKTAPMAYAERLLPVLVYGPGSSLAGLADPWQIDRIAGGDLASFHQHHYRPASAILSLIVPGSEAVESTATGAFFAWQGGPAPAPAPAGRRAASRPPTHLEVAGEPPTLLVALPPEDVALGATERYLFAALVAGAAGYPQAAGAPLPSGGVETLTVALAPGQDPAATWGRILSAVDRLAADGPRGRELPELVDLTRRRLLASLASPSFRGRWLAVTTAAGIDPDPELLLAAVEPRAFAAAAQRLKAAGGPLALLVAGPDSGGLSGALRLAPWQPLDPLARAAAEGARALVGAAIQAQGGHDRLRDIFHIDQRSRGLYLGPSGEVVPMKYHWVISPPDLAYFEAAHYRSRRYLVHRLIGDIVAVDRPRLPGTPLPAMTPLLRRQVLRHPALALLRPYDLGLVRLASPATAGETGAVTEVEVLDPDAGRARYWIRRRDGALVRMTFDLAPYADNSEEHNFDDFVWVEGVRVPMADQAFVKGRPLHEMCVEELSFPREIAPSFYLRAGEPSGSTWE